MSFQQHECKLIPTKDVSITIHLDENDKFWTLSISKLATEADLEENHYLEMIDDLIWQTTVEILHCPFCGKKLSAEECASKENFGQAHHSDFSRWNR